MLSKEKFCEFMQKLKDQYEAEQEWHKKADDFAYGISSELIEHNYLDLLIEIIIEAMDDKNKWIEHYCWGDYHGMQWFSYWDKDMAEHKIDTFEKLYDLIVEGE